MYPSRPPSSDMSSWERMRKTCDACQEAKVKCSQTKPSCHRCIRHGQPCIYSPHRRTGRPRKKAGRRAADAEGPVAEQAVLESRAAGTSGANGVLELLSTPEYLVAGTGENKGDLAHDVFPSLESLLDISAFEKEPGSRGTPNHQSESREGSQQNSYPAASLSDTMNDQLIFEHDLSFALPSPALNVDEHPQHSVQAPGTATPSADGDCGGRCYTVLLQQLSFLHRSLPDYSRPPIDAILLVEQNICSNIAEMLLQCPTCAGNRSAVLLLSTIIERVVQMLNWIIEKKTLTDSNNARLSRLALSSWAQNPSVPPPADSFQRTFCHVPLMVGQVELDAKTKQVFLKPLMILRIKKLAVKLQELRQITISSPRDSLFRAAELILIDCQRRLAYLRGQAQIWE
ncbi:conserved hypothetical protein [Microsporum canis CBS 113480]|uniref:Zn(2)-C6 fungal-type domain-containing protein n=1 Tax=Arthroderma otae (strain ATCC MYA-4605 / CBS 113480) TaxID=554155 RepID=C5FNM4_ARTOC|nr:conserved hypothetical protein [Microsporum canis CBS 113480]EEQ31727.1 conserved hypothetical protein [Microsporum canis CBS 113480]